MIRSFLAIPIPEAIADRLMDLQDNIHGAHWSPDDNLHLTLVFLGAQNRRTLEDLDAALIALREEAFDITLSGVGAFGGRESRLVYAGVQENPALRRLQAKTATAASQAEIEFERRKYAPHVTVGRLNRRSVAPEEIESWIASNALFEADPFRVEAFGLYRSDFTRDGPRYEQLAEYPLRDPSTA